MWRFNLETFHFFCRLLDEVPRFAFPDFERCLEPFFATGGGRRGSFGTGITTVFVRILFEMNGLPFLLRYHQNTKMRAIIRRIKNKKPTPMLRLIEKPMI